MRTRIEPARRRRGIILPLVTLCCIALFGFLALAIDLGMIAAAKAQAQNAADAAAMAGARTLDGYRPPGTASDAPISTADNHYADAGPNAKTAAKANAILGKPIADSQVTAVVGKLIFDPSQSKFFKVGDAANPLERAQVSNFATLDPVYSWSLTWARVSHTGGTFFGRFLENNTFGVTATAAAVHRPRDVMIVMDYSSSMSNDSMLGLGRWGDATVVDDTNGTTASRFSNNPDPVYPKWGHYSSFAASQMQISNDRTTVRQPSQTSANNEIFQASNWTAPHTLNKNRAALLTGFYDTAMTDPANPPPSAFQAAGSGDSQGKMGGDDADLLLKTSTGAYAATLAAARINGSAVTTPRDANWETNGYGASFKGYTLGPGYYGKTFFIWPPDPRTTQDWRRRFFVMKNPNTGAWDTPLRDNALLWDPRGNWRSPTYRAATSGTGGVGIPVGWPNGVPNTGNTTYTNSYPAITNPTTTDGDYYRINYEEIFRWLHSSPDPFPNQLRAGRIAFYTQKINPPPSGLNARFWSDNTASYGGFDTNNLQFWKQYIDHVLGLDQTGASAWRIVDQINIPNCACWMGYGNMQPWGTPVITPRSALPTTNTPYMNYGDNPDRPKLQFWFGPLTMVDSFYNHNLGRFKLPGTVREQPLFACKMGMQGAMRYIEKNHPNDTLGLIFFNGDRGRFPRPRVALGKDYTRMVNSLWYPSNRVDNTYSPSAAAGSATGPVWWTAMPSDTPHANGGTNYTFPLMLVYNQFSESASLRSFNPSAPSGDAGGNGRRGAQKLVLFVTDGQPNNGTSINNFTSSVSSGGANNSYYGIRWKSGGGEDGYTAASGGGTFNNATLRTQIYSVAGQICADYQASLPGFSTPRKPAMIHCIGFGQLFEEDTPERQNALVTFKEVERIGKVWGPGTDNPTYETQHGEPVVNWKCITGSDQEILDKLVGAVSRVARSGFQLSLVE